MRWLRTILSRLLGLFVDDASLAAAILAWVGLARLLLPHLGLSQPEKGAILFLGLATILIASALRRAGG